MYYMTYDFHSFLFIYRTLQMYVQVPTEPQLPTPRMLIIYSTLLTHVRVGQPT